MPEAASRSDVNDHPAEASGITENLAAITAVADQYDHHDNVLTDWRPLIHTSDGWSRVAGTSGPTDASEVRVPVELVTRSRMGIGAAAFALAIAAGFGANHLSYTTNDILTGALIVVAMGLFTVGLVFGSSLDHVREIEVDDPVTAQLIVAAWRLWLSATPEEREFLGDVPSDCRELAAGSVAADHAEAGDDPTDPRVGRWAEQTAEALRARHTSRCQLYATMLAEAASAIRDRRVRADTPARVAKLKQAFDEAQHDPMADRMAEHLDRIAAVRAALNDPALAEEIPDPDAHANAWADVHDADFSRPLQQPGTG